MSEYKRNNINITYHSKLAEDVLNNIEQNLKITPSRTVEWIYEEQTFDGVDQFGPKSIIYNLFIVVYDHNTKVYSCYVYNTEDYKVRGKKNVYYYLIGEYTSDKFVHVKTWRDLHSNYKSNVNF